MTSSPETASLLTDFLHIIDGHRLDIAPDAYQKIRQFLVRNIRYAEGYHSISVEDFVSKKHNPETEGATWSDGTPVRNLRHIRGQLYESERGSHQDTDLIFYQPGFEAQYREQLKTLFYAVWFSRQPNLRAALEQLPESDETHGLRIIVDIHPSEFKDAIKEWKANSPFWASLKEHGF